MVSAEDMKPLKHNYSKGVFLDIVSKNKNEWKRQVNFINSLEGVNHVEIWIEEDLTVSELKFLKSLLKKYKILVHGPFIHVSLVSPHKSIREITIKLYLRTLKIAQILGAELVTFHCGTKTKFFPKEEAITLLTQNLKRIHEHYDGKISFTIENLPPESVGGVQIHYPSSLNDLIYLKKLLPWLKFTVDLGHAFQGKENLYEISKFLKRYRNSILDIHLHDATLGGRAHLSLGEGELKVNIFFQLLKEIRYTGYISLETITRKDTQESWGKIRKL